MASRIKENRRKLGGGEPAAKKNLLVIAPFMTQDPAKTFLVLILKYLTQLGWDATVVSIDSSSPKLASVTTNNWHGVTMVKVPPSQSFRTRSIGWLFRKRTEIIHRRRILAGKGKKSDVRSLVLTIGQLALAALTAPAGFAGQNAAFPRDLWEALHTLHNQRLFSVVVSLYGPFLSHQLARRFSTETGLPWVAFTKDYYSGGPYRDMCGVPVLLGRFRDLLKRWQEGRVLSQSAIIIAYCEPLAEYLRTFIRKQAVKVILNCYDEEDFSGHSFPAVHYTNRSFVIACVGTINHQDFHMFFEAMRELLAEAGCLNGSAGIKVRFVGAREEILRSYAERYSCIDALEILPPVSHREAMVQMQEGTCLLFPQTPGILPRRTPEYMAARRPILAFPRCPSAASEPILQQYGAAVIASDKEAIKSTLLRWYQEFQTTGKVSLPLNEELVQSFSARHRAQQLNEVLQEVLEQSITHVDAAVSLRS